VTALSHAVVCRRRTLHNNRISTIANGVFTGLTALTQLYGVGLCGSWVIFVALCLVVAWMRGAYFPGLISPGLFEACSLYNEISRPPARQRYRWAYVNRFQGKWLGMVRAFFCLFSFISALEPGKVFLKMNFEEYSLFW
jgi:hypothetical protein